ncbi:hypothetical protein QPJ18_000590 [Escherichia coli]|nr:hypothetical protein [Escherichia coli]
MKVILKISDIKFLLLSVAFFFLGMHLVYFAAFFFLITADRLLFSLTTARFRIKEYFGVLICILYLCVTYIVGHDNMHIDRSYLPLILLVLTIVIFYILIPKNEKESFFFIQAYILGMLFKSGITVIYSILVGGESYGYGMLLDPFSNTVVNSPAYVALTSISFAYFYTNIFSEQTNLSKKLNVLFSILSLLIATYLGGRSFFVIAVLTIFLNMLAYKQSRSGISILLIFVMGIITIISYLFSELIRDKVNFIFLRFTNSGLESPRFLLWRDALNKIPDFPFGDFSVNTSIEFTYWYHNLWFDTARLGGWIALFLLIIINIYFIFHYKLLKTNGILKQLTIIQLVTLLVMSQEVILEGVLEVIGVYIMSGLLLVRLLYWHHDGVNK